MANRLPFRDSFFHDRSPRFDWLVDHANRSIVYGVGVVDEVSRGTFYASSLDGSHLDATGDTSGLFFPC